MPLNIKNAAVERLAAEAARRQGISKTEAVRRALESQLERLDAPAVGGRAARLAAFLERDVWPHVPAKALGSEVSRRERERILGYGDEGV